MPAISFQKQFSTKVEQGEKRTTIRKLRKRGNIKPGDTLYLWELQRTSGRRKLMDATCKDVKPISITNDFIILGNKILNNQEKYRLATGDGFDSILAMYEFFDYNYTLPFDGVLIEW